MARFDVHRLEFPTPTPLVVNVQADLLSSLATRVVIPLAPYNAASPETLQRLNPVLSLNGERFLLLTADLSVVAASEISEPMGNLEDQRNLIVDAIDFLLQGF